MNKQFEAVVEGQKKVMEFWDNVSKQMTGAFPTETQKEGNGKEDIFSNWYKQQAAFFEEAQKLFKGENSLPNNSEQFRQWVEAQTKFAEQWLDLYQKQVEKAGIKMPVGSLGMNPQKQFEAGMEQWNNWLKEGNRFMQGQLLNKMPSSMQPHYTNFLEAYNYMAKFWEPINQFIRNGVTDQETLKKFFSQDSYQNMVNQIMGFRTIGNTSELIETVNSWFEKVLEFTKGEWEGLDTINQRWKEQSKDFFKTDQFSGFKVASSFNNRLRDQLVPYYNVMAQGRETEIAKYLRDLQFTYISFILKSTELQSQVYEAGQFALPDTIKKYYQEFKEQQKTPNYNDFFKEYVNELENQILKVLHSDEYSKLQSEVSATGTNMQSMSQKMMELMFVDLPFLTKSDGDDFAKENAALRKKVRTMEQRLAELEKLVAQGVNLPANSEDQKKKLLEVVGIASDHHDLKLIKGIGPKLEKMLNKIGISTFQQVGKMTDREYELVDHLLEGFQGRAKRDHWAEQARDILLAAN